MFYGKCRYIYHTSGQIIIFHQPGFPWNKGISLSKPPFKVRSCEVAIIWPDTWMLWVCTGNLLRGSFLNMNLWFFRTAHVFTSSRDTPRLGWSILHPKQKTALFSTSTSHPAPSTRFFGGEICLFQGFPGGFDAFTRWGLWRFARAKVHQTSGSQTRRDHRLGLTFCWWCFFFASWPYP